jgi:hypothetical protein
VSGAIKCAGCRREVESGRECYDGDRALVCPTCFADLIDSEGHSVADLRWYPELARLAARVGELERERDAARAELEEVLSILGLSGSDPDVCCCGSMISDRTCHTAGHSPRSMREYALTSMVEQASALAAKLAQHREALKPFAKVAAVYHESAPDSVLVWGGMDGEVSSGGVWRTLTLGDCRRARDVMEAGR